MLRLYWSTIILVSEDSDQWETIYLDAGDTDDHGLWKRLSLKIRSPDSGYIGAGCFTERAGVMWPVASATMWILILIPTSIFQYNGPSSNPGLSPSVTSRD